MKVNNFVIGKRITVGAGVGAVAKIFSTLFPEHAIIIYESATVVTLSAQVFIANKMSITTK